MADARRARITLAAEDATAGAFASVSRRFTALQGDVAGMAARFSALGAAIAGSLAVQGVFDRFSRAVEGLDKLNDVADATGSTVEKLSALEDMAARTGNSFEDVQAAVIKLNKALGEASDPGSKAAESFRLLGLNVGELKNLDPSEALLRVAKAMDGFGNTGNRARVAQELFGKSLSRVLPLLADMAGKGELVGKVTEEQAKQAERFNQQLATMRKNSEDLNRELAGQLLPTLNRYGELVLRLQQGPGLLAGIGEAFKGNVFSNAQQALDFYSAKLKEVDAQMRIVTKATGDQRFGFAEAAKRRLEELGAERGKVAALAEVYRDLVNASSAGAGRGVGVKAEKKAIGDFADKPAGGAARDKGFISNSIEDEAFRAALKAIEGTDIGKVRELEAALAKLFELQRETKGDPAVVQAIERTREELEKFSPAAQAAAAEKKKLDELLAATPIAQMERLREEADLLARKMGETNDRATLDKLGEALNATFDRMRALRGEAQKTFDAFSEFSRQAASNIQDALGETMLQLLDGKFDSLEKLWGNMLKRLVAQAAAAQLGRWLLGDDYGRTGTIGGAAGGFFNWLGTLGQRAGGGDVMAGRAYIVGERGPEVVVPKADATVLPNGVVPRAQAAGGMTVNLYGEISQATQRYVQAAMAQFEARQLARARLG